MSRILESLNDRQREAVQATEGYFRIIAGAGSGKTKTLTHRFAYLVQEIGVPSNRILCVTFTNKAAAEMRGRVKQLLGENITDEYICTFHSFCVKVLRREIQRLGYQQTFSILDMTDQKSLIKEVFEEMGLSSNDGITAKDALKHIEMCKTGEGWEHVVKLLVAPNDPVIPAEAEVKDRILLNYLTLQRKNLSLDFNDLISFTLYLLQTNHQVLDTWSNAFSYIMVDETQDNSRRQWAMLELLAKACRNLFVVGDPDQAIYSFRGARPEGLVKFDKVFSPCTTIVLDQNYRSTPTILGAANDIIVHNRLRVKKELYTDNVDPGSPIEWIHADNDKNESLYVASKVQSLLENGAKSDDIAVLFRVSALSRSVEQAFIQNGIKYQVFGGMRFFERKEIKDVMAYLTMAETPDNDMAFLRTYNYPSRKLGKAFINRIKELAKADGSSYFAALLKHYGSVKEVTRSGAAEYIKLANQIQGLKGGSISDLATYILDQTGIMKELRESEDTERLDNVVELQNSILSYENEHKDDEDFSLKTYLQDISLYTNVDAKDKEDSIKLMTIHQSKGLEFDSNGDYDVLTIGTRVKHPAFGDGTIEKVESSRNEYLIRMDRTDSLMHIRMDYKGLTVITDAPKDDNTTDCLPADEPESQPTEEVVEPTAPALMWKAGDEVIHPLFGLGKIMEVNPDSREYSIYVNQGGFTISVDFNFDGLRAKS